MGDGNTRLGHQLAQLGRGAVDCLYAVVHPKHLTLAQQFTADGLDRHAFIPATDVRENRLSVGGWRLQQRHVANSNQAHLQRPRNRRGRQRQHIDVVFQLLHRFFRLNTEALFFVDHEQTKVLEDDAVLQQSMRSDHAINFAVLQSLEHDLGFLGGEEATQYLNANRIASEAVGERVAVLCRQQRRRRQHRDLLAVLDRFERSTDRDLGLAKANIAAHQSIHRIGALHIDLDLVDRLALIGRLHKWERLLHLVLPRRIHPERVADGVHPLLVEHDQLVGNLAHCAAYPPFRLREVATAQSVQRRRLAAHILPQRIDLIAGHVQLVAALVVQQQVVALGAANRTLDHALVLADAVLIVHDVVARLEIFEQSGALPLTRPCAAMCTPPAGEIGLGDHGQLRQRHIAAAMQRSGDDVATGTSELLGDRGFRFQH